jgi:hypothetical protein
MVGRPLDTDVVIRWLILGIDNRDESLSKYRDVEEARSLEPIKARRGVDTFFLSHQWYY